MHQHHPLVGELTVLLWICECCCYFSVWCSALVMDGTCIGMQMGSKTTNNPKYGKTGASRVGHMLFRWVAIFGSTNCSTKSLSSEYRTKRYRNDFTGFNNVHYPWTEYAIMPASVGSTNYPCQAPACSADPTFLLL